MSPPRVRVTYPDIAPSPFQSSNHRSNTADDGERLIQNEDPPPEYSTLPPSSVVTDDDNLYAHIYVEPFRAAARAPSQAIPAIPAIPAFPAIPAIPAIPPRVTVTNPPRTRVTFLPRVFQIPRLVPFAEDEPAAAAVGRTSNATQIQLSFFGMDENTTSLVNNIVELGITAVALLGTVVTYFFLRRQVKREDREMENQQKLFQEWKEEGSIPEDEAFVFTGTDGKGKKEKYSIGGGRLHARHWKSEDLTSY